MGFDFAMVACTKTQILATDIIFEPTIFVKISDTFKQRETVFPKESFKVGHKAFSIFQW